MAAKEVLSLDEIVPQALVPQVGDTYEMPRDVNITGDLTVTGTIPAPPAHNQAWSTITTTPTTMAGYGISDTKANFNTACSDGTFMYTGDAPTSHTHPYTALADGTDGELITWDAAGNIAVVATGTATHVLTSNGAGAAPTFQAPAGGGWANMSAAVWAGGTQSEVADGASAVAFAYDTDAAYSTTGSKLAAWSNNGTEKLAISYAGCLSINSGATTAAHAESINLNFSSVSTFTSSGQYSCVIGVTNKASGASSFALGSSNTASGPNSCCIGQTNTASGYYTFSANAYNTASEYCGSAFGSRAINPHRVTMALGGEQFVSNQPAQNLWSCLKAATTDATQTTMQAYSTNMIIPADTTWAFSALIAARSDEADGNNAAIYKIEGGLKRDEANNTAIVGSVTVTVIAEDTDAIPWSVDCVADDTNEALAIRVTGEAATNIRWVCDLHIAAVIFA